MNNDLENNLELALKTQASQIEPSGDFADNVNQKYGSLKRRRTATKIGTYSAALMLIVGGIFFVSQSNRGESNVATNDGVAENENDVASDLSVPIEFTWYAQIDLRDDITAQQLLEVEEKLSQSTHLDKYKYISSEEAYAKFISDPNEDPEKHDVSEFSESFDVWSTSNISFTTFADEIYALPHLRSVAWNEEMFDTHGGRIAAYNKQLALSTGGSYEVMEEADVIDETEDPRTSDITLWFKSTITKEQTDEVSELLSQSKYVEEYKFTGSGEGYMDFIEYYKDDSGNTDSIGVGSMPALFELKLKANADFDAAAAELYNLPYLRSIFWPEGSPSTSKYEDELRKTAGYQITMELRESVSQAQIFEIARNLNESKLVKSYELVAPTKVYEEFKEYYKDSPEILDLVSKEQLEAPSYTVELEPGIDYRDKFLPEFRILPGVGEIY